MTPPTTEPTAAAGGVGTARDETGRQFAKLAQRSRAELRMIDLGGR